MSSRFSFVVEISQHTPNTSTANKSVLGKVDASAEFDINRLIQQNRCYAWQMTVNAKSIQIWKQTVTTTIVKLN